MNDSSNLTRQTLYQSVWAQPMTKVAAGIAISDVALRKICVKHDLPVPGIGYWAKIAAGKTVTQVPLPPISGSVLDEIRIHGAPASRLDRKSTRLNSSHLGISYAVFCLKKNI